MFKNWGPLLQSKFNKISKKKKEFKHSNQNRKALHPFLLLSANALK